MAGIDNLADVMGRDADMDHVERDRLCDAAAAEITRLRELLRQAEDGGRDMAEQDIVERLSDLARFYLNERPTVNPQERSPTLVELGEPEAQEIASELYKAINEIQRLRAALAAETEECARVAEDFEAQVRNKITKTVDMHGDFSSIYVGAIYASKRIAAAIRARGAV